jgi:hypothetical protein
VRQERRLLDLKGNLKLLRMCYEISMRRFEELRQGQNLPDFEITRRKIMEEDEREGTLEEGVRKS